ncbi:hypothetical protein HQ346_14380 [Rhodococcus sp. BP-252]|uniref:hypothetical protein n=1 Tax=unclassified Rhodococcus (in: high G+C Gram-positive bacteria) TaxID=192944 RepID=UPI001C9A5A0E|nr:MULTISPECIES: hypothetical protein [unclassified Rhodococcus (in: high G+C Gram-positive bacteria)]MBY6412870.1 hypothetical protein [Rhodococcus sp. BP-320]MBY6417593.1 hypothetical protein [Rhodococcus sp. BP-321]MBY6423035.1 hypothetical protein [Rhodococcus sp. BP-324]MBY6427617.1 hypothetical protein [Rhodococcus sp. BP-323]MBY6432781.1 hypothetical protein [Rhodococcus sp. BP-322]
MTSSTQPPSARPRGIRRLLGILALTALFTVLAGGIASAQAANPFDGVSPDLGLLGPALNSTWKRILAAVWGGCFAAAGLYLVTSFLKLRKARNRGMSNDLSDASEDVKASLYCIAGVAGVSPIFGAMLFLIQPAA